jgi:hypothetical protein
MNAKLELLSDEVVLLFNVFEVNLRVKLKLKVLLAMLVIAW